MLWGAALTLATWLRCTELEDPTYNYVLDTSNYYVSVSATQLIQFTIEYYRLLYTYDICLTVHIINTSLL